jgi:hypothetical protein
MYQTKNLKNKVEVKGDVALIHVRRAGYDHIVIVDKEDLPYIDGMVKNRLNIDSNGYVQHKQMVNGEWKTFQLHRKILSAFDWETVSFKNGNKLDLRWSNLQGKTTYRGF